MFFAVGEAARANSQASIECSSGFAQLWKFGPDFEEMVQNRRQFAASWFRSRLRQMNSAQTLNNARRGKPASEYGAIEAIAPELMPKDPQLAKMADRVNFLFQDTKSLESYLSALTEDSARYLIQRGKLQSTPGAIDTMVSSSETHLDFLKTMALRVGWKKVHIEDEVSHPEVFRQQVLGRAELWYDREGGEIGHTASAHLLQWIYITPVLEKEFGVGSAKQFLQYLSTPEGFKLWDDLFDRGPLHVRDLRGPRAFSELRTAGPNAGWTGFH